MIDTAGLAATVLSIVSQMHRMRQPRIVPTQIALSHVLECVFWSSVDRYEGNPFRARIFFAPRVALTGSEGIIKLVSPLPITSHELRRLSPAHASNGALLAVEDADGALHIEGILGSFPSVRMSSPALLCVECRGPGALRVCVGSQPILEFIRGKLKILGGMSLDRRGASALLENEVLAATNQPHRVLIVSSMLLDIGQAIEDLGTGGALWILPSGAAMDGDLTALGHQVEMGSTWWEPYREMWENRTSLINWTAPLL